MIELGEFEEMPRPEFTGNTRFSVGISGGKDSSAVLLWMIHKSGVPKEQILASFADTGNEHEWTYAHVEKISNEVHPVVTLKPKLDYYQLALKKKRFPGAKARFCTQHLKIYPSEDYIRSLQSEGFDVISVSGVRANESKDRSKLGEWDVAGFNLHYKQWRPLIRWTLDDVLAIHREFKFPLNPLYEIGAQRVGCFPCIMSRKAEIRLIALKFPERIDMIRKAEQEFQRRYGRYSSFFPAQVIPERFRSMDYVNKEGERIKVATIDDVVRWSMTGSRARGHYTDDELFPGFESAGISCSSGFCE